MNLNLDNMDEDFLIGHCAIGLEQLCKVSMATTHGVSGSVNISRILVRRGKPMYNLDSKTLQVPYSVCVQQVLSSDDL